MVSRNRNGFAKLHGRGVMFRETIKITKKHRKWFRETRVNSKKSGFVGLSNSHLFRFRWRGQLNNRPPHWLLPPTGTARCCAVPPLPRRRGKIKAGFASLKHDSSIAFRRVDDLCPCPTSRITLMTIATSALRRSCSSNWTQLPPCATRTALTKATP